MGLYEYRHLDDIIEKKINKYNNHEQSNDFH